MKGLYLLLFSLLFSLPVQAADDTDQMGIIESDAAAWAEQKSASESKAKTGGIVGGVGAVGGVVGDLIINSDNSKKDAAQ